MEVEWPMNKIAGLSAGAFWWAVTAVPGVFGSPATEPGTTAAKPSAEIRFDNASFYGADGKFSDRVQAMLAHIPLGRPGTCEEVAHAALFLAAPESSYINGAVLTVDGGWLAGYIRETTGSYLPAFRVAIVIVAAGLICLIFAKAPIHPSLKEKSAAARAA